MPDRPVVFTRSFAAITAAFVLLGAPENLLGQDKKDKNQSPIPGTTVSTHQAPGAIPDLPKDKALAKTQVGLIYVEPLPGTENDPAPKYTLKIARASELELKRTPDDNFMIKADGKPDIVIPGYPYSMRVDAINQKGQNEASLSGRIEDVIIKWFDATGDGLSEKIHDFFTRKRDKKNPDIVMELPAELAELSMFTGERDKRSLEAAARATQSTLSPSVKTAVGVITPVADRTANVQAAGVSKEIIHKQ